MAIDALYLHCLKRSVDILRGDGASDKRLTALLLAYPDLLVTRSDLARILGEATVAGAPQRPDAAEIWAYHGLPGSGEPIYDSLELLRRMGIDATVIDVAKLRGMERIVDLNVPLPDDLRRRFDLVVDTGTCEHCFNVANAFASACDAVAVGGMLVHAAPLTRINHGFWSFNPTIYPDFFEDNGYELKLLTGVKGTLRGGFETFDIDAFARFVPPPESAMYVVAQRKEARDLRWPVQRKYRGMIR